MTKCRKSILIATLTDVLSFSRKPNKTLRIKLENHGPGHMLISNTDMTSMNYSVNRSIHSFKLKCILFYYLYHSISRFIMDNTIRNQKKDDDENEYGMRKITYLEKYGIKHFPYRGKRKYAPSIYRSVDGRMVISNDIFGLTIRQFERMYKDCLHRRKTHEQWILNLRYPDKSSNEYLEYLQNCTDFNKGYTLINKLDN